jgi:hypothetical protein
MPRIACERHVSERRAKARRSSAGVSRGAVHVRAYGPRIVGTLKCRPYKDYAPQTKISDGPLPPKVL